MERATQKDSINNEQKKKSGWERRQSLSDSDTSRSSDDMSPLEDIDNDGQLTSSAELQGIFNQIFPQQEEIVYAFGYGSGVFVQQEQKQTQERDDKNDDDVEVGRPQAQETKMLDMILVVRDSLKFHTMNQQINPHHYAPIFRHGGSSCSTWWQRHTIHNVFGSGSWFYNPKVYFNLVETPFLKYGVMDVQDLASDLQNWDSLYVAGRMHKPTATIILDHDRDGTDLWGLQQQHNLPAAVSMALLLEACNNSQQHNNTETMTGMTSLADLYSHISALSYTGDFRMQVGAEDPNKVNKLVHSPGQLGRFHQLYSKPALEPLVECGLLSLSSSTEDDAISSTTGSSILASTISWNLRDAAAIRHLWEQLPQRFQHLSHFKHHILNITNHSYNNNNTTKNKSMLNRAAQSELQTELHHIVAPAARYQSFKGLWTAGWSKSARYALAKLSKGLLRKK